MKHCILFILLFSFLPIHANNSATNSLPNSSSSAKQGEVDKDTQVVAESMGAMVQALATFSQNPHNPVVAGTCALQALGAFIKMLIQIFDDFAPTRSLRTDQEIEQWYLNLPKEKQLQIMQLMLAYEQAHQCDPIWEKVHSCGFLSLRK